jgi:NAD(P)-dependent dehydrogenase (short-subunit alcohol dehydrogenase family)
VFSVVHLDSQNRVLDYVEMFRGTVSQTSVYPREVVRDALLRNSSALLLVHNHPSGVADTSKADEFLSQMLKASAALIDVRVLHHFIVAGSAVQSMSKKRVWSDPWAFGPIFVLSSTARGARAQGRAEHGRIPCSPILAPTALSLRVTSRRGWLLCSANAIH